jgi:hypothetical protein
LDDAEKARWNDTIAPALAIALEQPAGYKTVGEIKALMLGE